MLGLEKSILRNRAAELRMRGAIHESLILEAAAMVIESGMKAIRESKDIPSFHSNILFHCKDIFDNGVLY